MKVYVLVHNSSYILGDNAGAVETNPCNKLPIVLRIPVQPSQTCFTRKCLQFGKYYCFYDDLSLLLQYSNHRRKEWNPDFGLKIINRLLLSLKKLKEKVEVVGGLSRSHTNDRKQRGMTNTPPERAWPLNWESVCDNFKLKASRAKIIK